MLRQIRIGAMALAAAMVVPLALVQAFDESRYPDLKGQWHRVGAPRWVLPGGPKAPLSPEYQAVFDANVAEMRAGGQGNVPSWYCLPQGMPMMMNVYDPMEVIVTPTVTYILISHINDSYRRIYTDGREWLEDTETTYAGYSIGKWIDEDGDGRYDVLEVETRFLKAPRTYNSTGIPFHKDGKTVIKERFYLDKKDPNTLHFEITSIDNALTKPWTVKKTVKRSPNPRPTWISEACAEDNLFVKIGNESYMLSPDGHLMPTKKDQPPPDSRYFKQPQR